jgi:hypothetical protein
MKLIAGIFQGYDSQALAHTATAFSKELRMTPAALAPAFTTGLFGMGRGLAVRTTGGSYRSSAGLYGLSLYLGWVHPSHTFRKVHTALSGLGMGGIPAVNPSFISEFVPMRVRK